MFWYHVNVYWIRIHWKYFTLLIWPIKLPTSYPSFFSFHVGDCLFIIHEIRIRLNIFCLLDSWAFNWNEFFDYKVFVMLYLKSIFCKYMFGVLLFLFKNVLNCKIKIQHRRKGNKIKCLYLSFTAYRMDNAYCTKR